MANKKGYIKLHRGILDWEWFDDPSTTMVFLYLLLTANIEEKNYHGETIPVGSTVVGRKMLAEKTGLSERNVRTALEHLKSTNEITIKSTNRFSVITVVNWGKYQLCNKQTDQQTDQQSANNRPTTDQQLTTPKEYKNIRNKEIKKYIYSDVPELNEAIKDFIAHRKQLKKPMTDRAVQLLINKLNKMTTDIDTQIAILNQSIERGWQTVYELKEPIKKEKNYDNFDTELC